MGFSPFCFGFREDPRTVGTGRAKSKPRPPSSDSTGEGRVEGLWRRLTGWGSLRPGFPVAPVGDRDVLDGRPVLHWLRVEVHQGVDLFGQVGPDRQAPPFDLLLKDRGRGWPPAFRPGPD